MTLVIVAPGNLGTDFDFLRTAGKIGVSWAMTPTWSGQHAFLVSPIIPTPALSDSSTKAATTAFVAGLLSNSALLGALFAALPTNPPVAAGQAWIDNGVVRVS